LENQKEKESGVKFEQDMKDMREEMNQLFKKIMLMVQKEPNFVTSKT
jgi:hypothetical protein